MKNTLAALFFSMAVSSFGQTLNDYKYVQVPSVFAFKKTADPYGLSTLMKSLFTKYGFEPYLDNEASPADFKNYNCNKLYADILENNNFTNTKLTIVLKDCQGRELFRSAEGKSRDKDFKIAYTSAFREAARSLEGLGYTYSGKPLAPDTPNAKPAVPATPVQPATSVQPAASKTTLFAQPITDGFQLVDTTPKVVLKFWKTSQPNVFIADRSGTPALVRNEGGKWILEYYSAGVLQAETLDIKF